MDNKRGSIDLLRFNKARKTKLGSQMGIFIPITDVSGENYNPSVYVNEKHAYVSIRINEHGSVRTGSNGKEQKTTHIIKLQLPSAMYEKYKDDKDVLYSFTPIIGNLEENLVEDKQPTYVEENESGVEDLPF